MVLVSVADILHLARYALSKKSVVERVVDCAEGGSIDPRADS
jgi:hypothetical protein